VNKRNGVDCRTHVRSKVQIAGPSNDVMPMKVVEVEMFVENFSEG
jgi:hypothetical protein